MEKVQLTRNSRSSNVAKYGLLDAEERSMDNHACAFPSMINRLCLVSSLARFTGGISAILSTIDTLINHMILFTGMHHADSRD